MDGLQARKFQFVAAPRSQGELIVNPPPGATTYGTGEGLVAVVAASLTPQAMALMTLFSSPIATNNAWAQGQLPTGEPLGLLDAYVTIYADGVDFGVVFGETLGIVLGVNSPSLTAVGTLDSSGNYTAAGTECWRIPAGTERRILLALGIDKFLGFVASATGGYLRLYQSSPQLC